MAELSEKAKEVRKRYMREYMREYRKLNKQMLDEKLKIWRNKPENKIRLKEYTRRYWEKVAAEEAQEDAQ